MQHMHRLKYRSERRQSRSVALPITLLVVVGAMIWALHELAIMPYRPPMDMSTFLGGPEEAFVSALIAILAVIWVTILLWCFIRVRRPGSAA
jgi:NO-binding membrane sensor protein with MHYT domain